jgi:aspartyl-tRNA(Asn)/glutamyl-tRNA(Gln) amidotransferase subunit C
MELLVRWCAGPGRFCGAGKGALPWYTRLPMAALSEQDVLHVASLARLRLAPSEVSRMAVELSAILSYVQKLSELDTTNVAPTAHVQVERLALRDDEPRAGLRHEDALREAPRTAHDGFAVPGFVEE